MFSGQKRVNQSMARSVSYKINPHLADRPIAVFFCFVAHVSVCKKNVFLRSGAHSRQKLKGNR